MSDSRNSSYQAIGAHDNINTRINWDDASPAPVQERNESHPPIIQRAAPSVAPQMDVSKQNQATTFDWETRINHPGPYPPDVGSGAPSPIDWGYTLPEKPKEKFVLEVPERNPKMSHRDVKKPVDPSQFEDVPDSFFKFKNSDLQYEKQMREIRHTFQKGKRPPPPAKTVRIRFLFTGELSNLVLEGTFKTLEPVKALYDFVREHVFADDFDFTLLSPYPVKEMVNSEEATLKSYGINSLSIINVQLKGQIGSGTLTEAAKSVLSSL